VNLEAEDSDSVEVVGHHLALAARYRRELGEDDERTATLARRAAEYLTSGGRRALAAGDDQAAARLLDHAASLVGIDDRLGREARVDLGRAFTGTGQLERARVTFANVRNGARTQGERVLALRAELGLANFRVQTDPAMSNAEITKVAEDAIPVFEAEGDEYGLAFSWFLIHWGLFRGGRYEESIAAAEKAISHAKAAGDLREQFRALGAIAMAHLWGPTPVSEGEHRLDELLERSGHARLMEAFAVRVRGGFCSMTGDFEQGREHCNRAIEIYSEFGHQLSALGVVVELQRVERKAGRLDVAEDGLRTAYEAAAGLGDLGYVSWIAASLARVLADQQRFDEALAVVDRPDLNLHFGFTNVIVRVVRAEACAADGKRREAEAHAFEALRLIEATDILDLHGDVLMYLAELDEAAGRDVDAAKRVASAIELYERKGDVVSADRARVRTVPLGA
jgi:tetratricopeptide (TPR) repeat protein